MSYTHLLESDLHRRLKMSEQAASVCNRISENFCVNFKILTHVVDATMTVLWNEYSAIYKR